MDTRFKRPARPRTKRFEVIKIKEFRNPEMKREYEGKVEREIEAITTKEMNINELWKTIKSIMIRTAKEVCGKTIVNTRKKRTHWWAEEVKEKIRNKKTAWKKYI